MSNAPEHDAGSTERASDLLTVPEAAQRIRMSRAWTWERVYAGELPVIRLGRRVFVHEHDLELFVSTRRSYRAGRRP